MDDKETLQIRAIAKSLQGLIEHDGWSIARQKLTDKILDLQNAFNVDDSSVEKMIIDLKARKLATQILFEWLREIEGTPEQVQMNTTVITKKWVVQEDVV